MSKNILRSTTLAQLGELLTKTGSTLTLRQDRDQWVGELKDGTEYEARGSSCAIVLALLLDALFIHVESEVEGEV